MLGGVGIRYGEKLCGKGNEYQSREQSICKQKTEYEAENGLVGFYFFQAEDSIRDLVRSRGLGDVYERQVLGNPSGAISVLWIRRLLQFLSLTYI